MPAELTFLRHDYWKNKIVPDEHFFKPARYRTSLQSGDLKPPSPPPNQNVNPLGWKETVLGKSDVFENGWKGEDTQPGPANLDWYRLMKFGIRPKIDLIFRTPLTNEESEHGDDDATPFEVAQRVENVSYRDASTTAITVSSSASATTEVLDEGTLILEPEAEDVVADPPSLFNSVNWIANEGARAPLSTHNSVETTHSLGKGPSSKDLSGVDALLEDAGIYSKPTLNIKNELSSSASVGGDDDHMLAEAGLELDFTLHTIGRKAQIKFLKAQKQISDQLHATARKAQAEYLAESIAELQRLYEKAAREEIGDKAAEIQKEIQTIDNDMTALNIRRAKLIEDASAIEERKEQLEGMWEGKMAGLQKALDEIKYQELLCSSL